jgi:hypothetical protein
MLHPESLAAQVTKSDSDFVIVPPPSCWIRLRQCLKEYFTPGSFTAHLFASSEIPKSLQKKPVTISPKK